MLRRACAFGFTASAIVLLYLSDFTQQLVLYRTLAQNIFCRTKELCRLDTEGCPRWTGLYTGLILIASTQVTLDCHFFTHLPHRANTQVSKECTRRGFAFFHGQHFSPTFFPA